MRILVTGGAGFIGSHYVRQAMSGAYPGQTDAEILVLDLLTYAGCTANLAEVAHRSAYRFIHGDIRDADLVNRVMAGVDLVIHFAAESHVDRSIDGGADFVSTNVGGTQILLQAAVDHQVGKFVHVSTDEVYGSIEEGSWTEEHLLEPNSPYSAAKAGSDLIARSYHRTHGLPVCITRCSNNYGPYQFPEKVIPLFVTNLLDGRPVPLYGDGLNVRDWLHVDDHCRGIALVAEHGRPGEIYNIGGGTELTNRELTELLLEATGRDWSMVEPVADRLGHDRRYSVDISKISAELGYAPRVPFTEGIAATVDWYRDRRDWWEPLRERATVTRSGVTRSGVTKPGVVKPGVAK
ncbi:MAG TPA: dTDP-glucose 4,6-dehydratase [Pseudonocardia sp.]|jgi:dTDP-glucose 4,6-dehydratase|nr:dTDP-glucose 4,6-dehydratase [Pseudonocardia sp.]